jgi:hypothetical protein
MIKWWKGKWWLGRDIVWELVGVTGCVPRSWNLTWLHCFPYLYRLRTVNYIRHYSSHRLIISSTYMLMGAGRLATFLSWILAFSDRLIGSGDRWRSKHHTNTQSQSWGLGVQVWTGTWTPRQEWNELVLFVPGVQARRVFFGIPSWAHWFTNHRFYVTVQLDYSLTP